MPAVIFHPRPYISECSGRPTKARKMGIVTHVTKMVGKVMTKSMAMERRPKSTIKTTEGYRAEYLMLKGGGVVVVE